MLIQHYDRIIKRKGGIAERVKDMTRYEQELRSSEENYSEEMIQFFLSIFLHCPEDDCEERKSE